MMVELSVELVTGHSCSYRLSRVRTVGIYSNSKNTFHTNSKCSVRSAPHYSMGTRLSFGGVIHSTYSWLQDCSLSHVIWAIGCRDMINLKQQTMERVFLLLK